MRVSVSRVSIPVGSWRSNASKQEGVSIDADIRLSSLVSLGRTLTNHPGGSRGVRFNEDPGVLINLELRMKRYSPEWLSRQVGF